MKQLDHDSFEKMIAGATVISKDQYGDKVLQLSNGLMVKLFRLKRIFSSAVIWPYAKRFVLGARRLGELHIPSVKVIDAYRVKSIKRDIVVYEPLKGETLREALKNHEDKKTLLNGFAAFLAELHGKGVYFRSIHFGNVIVLPGGRFGLIDVSGLRIASSSLSVRKRVHNFKPIFRYKEDQEAILDLGLDPFMHGYVESSELPYNARQSFYAKMKRSLPPGRSESS
jgi:hypothetical protein